MVRKTGKHVSRSFYRLHGSCMFPKWFPYGNGANFNEDPSMRAIAKLLRARARNNPSKGQFMRALLNWMGPFDTSNHLHEFNMASSSHRRFMFFLPAMPTHLFFPGRLWPWTFSFQNMENAILWWKVPASGLIQNKTSLKANRGTDLPSTISW